MRNAIPDARRAAPGPSRSRALDAAVERALGRQRAAYAAEAERLVQAALALIRERGELEPPVAAIVKRARLSNQAFYRHFRGKHELLVAVLDHGSALLEEYLRARMAAASGPSERVRAWLRGMLEQALNARGAESTRPFALARAQLARHYPEEVAASERRLTALARAAIAEAKQAGELPHADPEADAEALYHLAMGWLAARLAEDTAPSRARAKRLEQFAMVGVNAGHSADDRGSPAGGTRARRARTIAAREAASGPAPHGGADRAQRGPPSPGLAGAERSS